MNKINNKNKLKQNSKKNKFKLFKKLLLQLLYKLKMKNKRWRRIVPIKNQFKRKHIQKKWRKKSSSCKINSYLKRNLKLKTLIK